MALIFDDIVYILELIYVKRFSHKLKLAPGNYETTETNNSSPSFITIRIDEIRFRVVFSFQGTENQVLRFDQKTFF